MLWNDITIDMMNPNIVLVGYNHSGDGEIKSMKSFQYFHGEKGEKL